MGGGGIIEIRRCANSGHVGTNGEPVVSVVIVNFSGGPLLSEAVRSALLSTIPVEVYVSDNGSTDDSLSSLRHLAADDRRLQIIETGQTGFVAPTLLDGHEYVLLLNPDAVIQPDTLVRMIGTLAA
jgi:GT2 family glycosyltransferase